MRTKGRMDLLGAALNAEESQAFQFRFRRSPRPTIMTCDWVSLEPFRTCPVRRDTNDVNAVALKIDSLRVSVTPNAS